jgi:hypothetical protein
VVDLGDFVVGDVGHGVRFLSTHRSDAQNA